MSSQIEAIDAVRQPRPQMLSVLIRGATMRYLEVGLAITAIVTAILVGQLR